MHWRQALRRAATRGHRGTREAWGGARRKRVPQCTRYQGGAAGSGSGGHAAQAWRLRTRQQRVLHDVLRLLHPPGRGLVEHLALEGDGGQQAVKRALPVGGHDDQLVAQVVCVPHLALRYRVMEVMEGRGRATARHGRTGAGARAWGGSAAARVGAFTVATVHTRVLIQRSACALPCTSCPCQGLCR